MVQAIHTAVAGRVRFKVEGLYRSEALKRLLEAQLARLRDISHVSANALTGNVLVCFNSGNTPQTIASLIEELVVDFHNHQPEVGAGEPQAPPPGSSREAAPPPSSLAKLKALFSSVEDQPQEPWHLLEPEAVLAALKTSRTEGLSRQAVKQNIQQYGPNVLPEAEPRSGLGNLHRSSSNPCRWRCWGRPPAFPCSPGASWTRC